MTPCLLALGSNLGDREAMLRTALDDITALPDVQLARHSTWYPSQPVGGPGGQGEFLNAAAVIETTIPLPRLLAELNQIESRLGRREGERWAARPIDVDILLYGSEVSETTTLTVPHPRMSYRRFVLEPAVEVAAKMLHPTIGWPVERLLLHLDSASDQVAIVSPSVESRERLAEIAVRQYGTNRVDAPTFATAEHHWPASWTIWIGVPAPARSAAAASDASALLYAAAAFPKLTVLLDGPFDKPADKLQWSTLVRQPGRGPTLRLKTTDTTEVDAETLAAIAGIWPDLGR